MWGRSTCHGSIPRLWLLRHDEQEPSSKQRTAEVGSRQPISTAISVKALWRWRSHAARTLRPAIAPRNPSSTRSTPTTPRRRHPSNQVGGQTQPEAAPEIDPEPQSEPESEPEPEPEPEPESTPANAGTYEISARVGGPCGDYAVFLRIVLFLNGQMTVDQLLTAGGDSFQSATGRWDEQMAVATHAEASFFEAWFFLFNLGDILSIYNVYGPSSAVVTPGSEPNLQDYAQVTTPEGLDEVTQGTDTCPTALLDLESTHTPFPESTG